LTTDFVWLVTIRVGKEERNWRVREARNRYQAVMPCIDKVIKEFSLPGRPYQYWASNQAKFGLEGILEIQVKFLEDGRKKKEVELEHPLSASD